MLAVFVATVLIANICGTPISSCFLGGALGTLIYQLITKFKSPMFISNSGATVSAVLGALALSADGQNYLMVMVGGLVIATVYCGMATIIKYKGIEAINKIFPPTIVGAVTIVIGLNLAGFIPTYVQVGGQNSIAGVIVAVITMLVIAASSYYFKGFMKTIPFLIGLIVGYICCIVLDVCGFNIIDWSVFQNIKWYPDLAFLHWRASDFSWSNVAQTVILFAPVAICALLEHYSDHACLSKIIAQPPKTQLGID